MSCLVYSHPDCLAHSAGPGHPECPARLAAVLEGIRSLPAGTVVDRQARAAPRAALARVHSPELLARILDQPVIDFDRLDADTAMNAHSQSAALHAAGAVIDAIDAVIAAEGSAPRHAFCAVRPPGHHATREQAMGFCLINAIACGAAHALTLPGISRVAIADFDVHHGNGTQDIFAEEPRVLYASSHQDPLYPGTGRAIERGCGNVFNAPLPSAAGSVAFRAAWRNSLLPSIDVFAPNLILVSAGFDAHGLDPLAGLDVEIADFVWLTAELARLADQHCNGRLVSVLEGGYSLTALRECAAAHVRVLADRPTDPG